MFIERISNVKWLCRRKWAINSFDFQFVLSCCIDVTSIIFVLLFLSALTDRERFLLLNKEYGSLVKEQEKQNAKIDDEVINLTHAPNILLFEDFQAIIYLT